MKNSKKLISIVVPCYNEEETIPIFYIEMEKIRKKINKVNFEYIFIDDGSKDNTMSSIRKIAMQNNCVRYLSFSRNFGKEAGMYAGLEASLGDYVAIMDVDLQDPPEMLIEMYNTLETEDYDCVALHSPDHKDYSIMRRLFTKMWYRLIGKISTTEQVVGARDFRLMKRPMVDSIIKMREYNRYSKGIFSFVGYKTKWIKYETPPRVAGKTKWNFWKLFKYALEGILAFSTTPLVMSAILGLLFCFISFVVIVFIIIKTLVWGDPVSGWPSLACIVIFTSGLQMFFLGIIGMYLSKAYLEVKGRPIYIVRETEKELKEKSINNK